MAGPSGAGLPPPAAQRAEPEDLLRRMNISNYAQVSAEIARVPPRPGRLPPPPPLSFSLGPQRKTVSVSSCGRRFQEKLPVVSAGAEPRSAGVEAMAWGAGQTRDPEQACPCGCSGPACTRVFLSLKRALTVFHSKRCLIQNSLVTEAFPGPGDAALGSPDFPCMGSARPRASSVSSTDQGEAAPSGSETSGPASGDRGDLPIEPFDWWLPLGQATFRAQESLRLGRRPCPIPVDTTLRAESRFESGNALHVLRVPVCTRGPADLPLAEPLPPTFRPREVDLGVRELGSSRGGVGASARAGTNTNAKTREGVSSSSAPPARQPSLLSTYRTHRCVTDNGYGASLHPYDQHYVVLMRPDSNTTGNNQWFYFAVGNTIAGLPYHFLVSNFTKSSSQFERGMQPVVLSERLYRTLGVGWCRAGREISYQHNHTLLSPAGAGAAERGAEALQQSQGGLLGAYYSLSFTLTFPFTNDVVYIAYSYPYTFTQGQLWLNNVIACSRLTPGGPDCQVGCGMASHEGGRDRYQSDSRFELVRSASSRDANSSGLSVESARSARSARSTRSDGSERLEKSERSASSASSAEPAGPLGSAEFGGIANSATTAGAADAADFVAITATHDPSLFSPLASSGDSLTGPDIRGMLSSLLQRAEYKRAKGALVDAPKAMLSHRVLCQSIGKNDVDLLTLTAPSLSKLELRSRQIVAISARIHPGEPQGSYLCEGLVEFLLSAHPVARLARRLFVFRVAPCMNPDGVVVGNYRCNLAGYDLNRVWPEPSSVAHPPVYFFKHMLQTAWSGDTGETAGQRYQRQYGAFQLERPGCAGHSGHQDRQDLWSQPRDQPRERLQQPLQPRRSDVAICLDLHGHSKKKNVFGYSCSDAPGANRYFRALNTISDYFDLPSCHFSISRSKEGTGRAVAHRELRIPHSFCVECTYSAVSKRGSPADGRQMTQADLRAAGRDLAAATLYTRYETLAELHALRTGCGAPFFDALERLIFSSPPAPREALRLPGSLAEWLGRTRPPGVSMEFSGGSLPRAALDRLAEVPQAGLCAVEDAYRVFPEEMECAYAVLAVCACLPLEISPMPADVDPDVGSEGGDSQAAEQPGDVAPSTGRTRGRRSRGAKPSRRPAGSSDESDDSDDDVVIHVGSHRTAGSSAGSGPSGSTGQAAPRGQKGGRRARAAARREFSVEQSGCGDFEAILDQELGIGAALGEATEERGPDVLGGGTGRAGDADLASGQPRGPGRPTSARQSQGGLERGERGEKGRGHQRPALSDRSERLDRQERLERLYGLPPSKQPRAHASSARGEGQGDGHGDGREDSRGSEQHRGRRPPSLTTPMPRPQRKRARESLSSFYDRLFRTLPKSRAPEGAETGAEGRGEEGRPERQERPARPQSATPGQKRARPASNMAGRRSGSVGQLARPERPPQTEEPVVMAPRPPGVRQVSQMEELQIPTVPRIPGLPWAAVPTWRSGRPRMLTVTPQPRPEMRRGSPSAREGLELEDHGMRLHTALPAPASPGWARPHSGAPLLVVERRDPGLSPVRPRPSSAAPGSRGAWSSAGATGAMTTPGLADTPPRDPFGPDAALSEALHRTRAQEAVSVLEKALGPRASAGSRLDYTGRRSESWAADFHLY